MKIVMATNNSGKVSELRDLLNIPEFDVVSLKEAGFCVEVSEDGNTFMENAIKKAVETAKITNMAAIGDDSGLCVNSLDGAPGIYSARWAGENATQDELIGKLLTALSDKDDRTAFFVCAIALATPDGKVLTAEGRCDGVILRRQSGEGGFGYDPVFYVPSENKTFADMSKSEKNKLSHRANAIIALKEKLKNYI